jgi:hypothetical protein
VDYFTAVKEGRERVRAAVEALQEVAGPSYPMLFLKMDVRPWTPVGAESLFSVVPGRGRTAAIVVCDADGNSKAMSAWVPEAEAEKWAGAMSSKGLARFTGQVRLPI